MTHHGAVVEVADALALVLAFAHDAQGEDFAGQDDGLEGVGQFVEVDVGDGLQFGDFAQVIVVGVELGARGRGTGAPVWRPPRFPPGNRRRGF